jgi:hypothetical protein
MRLQLMVGALVLVAGSAEARILPFGGHKAEKAASNASDQRICTTTTTVVRRGDVVLSTTSSTHCEEDNTQAAAPPAAGPATASAEAASPGAAAKAPKSAQASAQRATFGGSHSAAASLFGMGPKPSLTPRDVLGVWTAIERGKQDACTVLMSREVVSGGFRVFTSGCKGPLSGASAWRFEETAAGLYGSDGAPVGKLAGDKEHLSGTLADGGLLEMSR